MLYINAKQVNFANRKPDYEFRTVVAEYHKTIDEINEKYGGTIRFTIKEPLRLDPITKLALIPKPHSRRTTLKKTTDDGPQEWVWSPAGAKIKDGVAISTQPNFIIQRGEASFSVDSEPDFIYFLLNHSIVTKGILNVDDPEKTEDEKAAKRREENKLKELIYSDLSPLATDISKLNIIARKWGIVGVEEMSDSTIRNTLYDKVLKGEAARKKSDSAQGIQAFLKDFDLGEGVKVGATIQQAIDQGDLYFSKENNEWLMIVSKDQMPLSIMTVQETDRGRSRKLLTDYLINDKEAYATLQKILQGEAVIKHGQVIEGEPEKEVVDIGLDNLETAKHNDLQKAAKTLGIGQKGFGATSDRLRELIKEELERRA
jgi:hypothetical protein